MPSLGRRPRLATGPHRLVIVHAGLRRGENAGLFVQHVETVRWLFQDDPEWEIVPLDLLDPSCPDAALAADLVIVTMTPAPEIESLIRLRRARGLRTIFDIIDNPVAPGDWLDASHRLRSPLVRQSILFHASQCDVVQVYSPALARMFQTVNANVAVLDPYVPIEALPPKPAGFVFGWGGTRSHREDLRAIAPAVVRFCGRQPDAAFAFMGDREMFDELFADIPPGQARWRPFGSFDDYLRFVRGLHVGLAPLEPTPFNAARTDTKFATFAAGGAAAVLQDAPAYRRHASRARLFSTPDECERQLDALYADRAALHDLAARAHAWLRESRGPDALRAQRQRVYRTLLPERPAGMGTSPAPATADDLAARPAGEPSAPAADLAARLAGESLAPADDLVARLAGEPGRTPEATAAVCRDLLRERPDYAQAQWGLLQALESAGQRSEAAAFARSIEPHPVYADLVAALQARLDPAQIGRVASPVRRIRLQARGAADRLAYYREVLRHHPYDFFALSVVIRLLSSGASASAELDELYARAALVAPDLVPADRRPPHLQGLLPA